MKHSVTRHMIFQTRFGNGAVIYRDGPFSMIKTLLPRTNRKRLAESAGKEGWGEPGKHPKACIVSESLTDYFKGNLIPIPWEWMDMGDLTELQKSVLVTLTKIPYGQIRTYKDIAEAIGSPRACRFVGTTLANNPFPILIPCHRVILSNGSVGQFGGGTDLKRKMIELEAEHAKLLS